jgi:site-specific recombinase XerD
MRTTQVTTLSQDSIEQFRQWLSDRGRSAHTAKSYASDLQQLLLEVGLSSIDLLELETIGSRWLTANTGKLSHKTTGRRLTSLRAFARWAGQGQMFLDYTAPTPLRAMPHPLPEGMPGVFRMLDRAELPQVKISVALCGLAGLRISEALQLPPEDVDFAHHEILVNGKGQKERLVPMSVRLEDLLLEPVIQARIGGRPTLLTMADRLARRSITRLGKRAGLSQPVASHQLRATFATHLNNNGVPLRTIQEILGHAQVTTTEIYTAVNRKNMQDAVKDL